MANLTHLQTKAEKFPASENKGSVVNRVNLNTDSASQRNFSQGLSFLSSLLKPKLFSNSFPFGRDHFL